MLSKWCTKGRVKRRNSSRAHIFDEHAAMLIRTRAATQKITYLGEGTDARLPREAIERALPSTPLDQAPSISLLF